MMRKATILTWAALGYASLAAAQLTHHVPGTYGTIQTAIDASSNGDTVLVAPGTYAESIDFLGKAITVESASGPDVTVIEGDGENLVVAFKNGEGDDSVLRGFTIRNGGGYYGAVQVSYASPRILGNKITDNHACAGIGIYSYRGSPVIQGNEITDNVMGACSGGGGGGILITGPFSSAQILDNLIAGNVINSGSGGGIYLNYAGDTLIRNNIITGNSATAIYIPASLGGGIYSHEDSNPDLIQNIIYGNTADEGGGIYSRDTGYQQRGVRAVNNTIAGNVARHGRGSEIGSIGYDGASEYVNNVIAGETTASAIWCDPAYPTSGADYRNNNVIATDGVRFEGACSDPTGQDGNISSEPRFVDSSAGDFHLQFGSPSIDAGDSFDPDLPGVDADGTPRILDGDHDGVAVVDMGAFEKLNEIYSSKDSFVIKGKKNRNEGANPKLVVDARRSVLEFPIQGLSAAFVQGVELRLTLAEPAKYWGSNGRNVAVHRLLGHFVEGNGKKFEVPNGEKTSGSGPGATWNCAVDTEISNTKTDCETTWSGGGTLMAAQTDVALHTVNMTGTVTWDVTSDVLDALAEGESVVRFVVKREIENQGGHAEYHSREGADAAEDPSITPQLRINP